MATACIVVCALLLAALCTVALTWSPRLHPAERSASAGPRDVGKSWYFAEGTTRGGYSEYICLLNPNPQPVTADFTYMLGTGETIRRTYNLNPSSRTTVGVNGEVPAGSDVSVRVESSLPIMAERSMYFSRGASNICGDQAAGAPAPSARWYFAEGCTRTGFDTFLCLQNPGAQDSLVDISYYLGDGQTVVKRGVRVPATSRLTVHVHGPELGVGRNDDARGDVSTEVRSTNAVPIVAERPMYFDYAPYVSGGHDAVGATATAKQWYFAEGCTRSGFDTFLCLQNPGARDALVDLHYYLGDGTSVDKPNVRVARHSRVTVAVHNDALGVGRRDNAGGDVSTTVESKNGVGIIAERPSYYTYRPFWTGGHDALGATAPANAWYFAEGCTRQGFDTYLCLQNFGAGDALVDITYFCGDGFTQTRSGVRIPAHSRFTVPVHADQLGIGRQDSNRGDVGTRVVSANGVPIIAERVLYRSFRWRTIDKAALAGAWGRAEIVRGSTNRNTVALTFDIENNAATTYSILDTLKAKGVHSTIFLLGRLASSAPSLVSRIASDGNEVGNHSWSHPTFTGLSDDATAGQLNSTESTISGIIGMSTKPYFRFPGGARSAGNLACVNRLGYLSIYWTVDPWDWSSTRNPDQVYSIVTSQTGPGCIVLLHSTNNTAQSLPGIIDNLRAKGFELVTLTELLYPGP